MSRGNGLDPGRGRSEVVTEERRGEAPVIPLWPRGLRSFRRLQKNPLFTRLLKKGASDFSVGTPYMLCSPVCLNLRAWRARGAPEGVAQARVAGEVRRISEKFVSS